MRTIIPSVFILLITLSISFHAHALDHKKAKWKFKTQGTIRAAGVVAGERIFFGSADGNLYALHKKDGKLLWKFQSQGSIASTPAVTGDILIFTSRDNFIYALRQEDGSLLWKFAMQPIMEGYTEWEYFEASPAVSGNIVFIGSGDGNLYALNYEDGRLLWKFKTGNRIRATPLLANGVVYQPSNDGLVYALDARDGKMLWRFKTEGASLDKSQGFDRTCIFTRPCLKNDLLIFGSRDGNTYAIDINTHQEKWRFTYGSTWAMSVTVDDATAFVGWSTNKLFCAIDLKTGVQRWKYACGSVVYSTAAVDDDRVIFGSADGNLYCLNKSTGGELWQYSTGHEIHSSPIVDEKTIFFGCDDGYFYALEDGPEPMTAVYQPIPENAVNAYPVVDARITPYLLGEGFTQLDSAGLYSFMKARIHDKAPSVIVFAYDVIPSNIMGEEPEKGTARQYLETGGRILWFGGIPNMFNFDSKGRYRGGNRDISAASRLLGVDFVTPEESGNYYARATQAGLNKGLPSWFKATYAVVDPEDVTALAVDEYNRVSAWEKKFHPRSGSGFVSCRMWAFEVSIRDEHLALIRDLALDGLE